MGKGPYKVRGGPYEVRVHEMQRGMYGMHRGGMECMGRGCTRHSAWFRAEMPGTENHRGDVVGAAVCLCTLQGVCTLQGFTHRRPLHASGLLHIATPSHTTHLCTSPPPLKSGRTGLYYPPLAKNPCANRAALPPWLHFPLCHLPSAPVQ